MEIRMYLQMLQRGWWIILLTALIGVNVALTLDYFSMPIYEASAKFVVSPNPSLQGYDVVNSLATLDKRSIIKTYAEFLNSANVQAQAISDVGLSIEEIEDYKILTVVLPDTSILELLVTGPDIEICTALANRVGEYGVDSIRQLYDTYQINTLDPAFALPDPVKPMPIRDAGLALVLGTVLGSALAILSEQIRVPLETLRQRRLFDSASSAYNRRHFQRLLELEIIRARDEEGIFSLCLVRLDGLTELIDTLPQPITQRLLRRVTQMLKNNLKGTDTVGQWDPITFGILLPNTPYLAASGIMNRVRWELYAPMEITEDGEAIYLNPYTGIARSQEDETMPDLIQRTENELEEGKYSPPPEQPRTPQKPETQHHFATE